MRKVEIKNVEIQNFKGIEHQTVKFNHKTFISGRNGLGKTTIYNAVLWVLFDKDINGNSAADIRPRDHKGNEINNIEISVSVSLDVDGKEIVLKKIQKQNWVKKHGDEQKTFKGNINEFSINDIPKTQKAFKEYIADNICKEDIFYSCTNALAFFKLDTKKRRAKLIDLAGTVTDADVIDTDSRFLPLADMLADGTVDEVIARSKAAIKRFNNELESIPTRIDEQNNSKVDIDVAELELAVRSLNEQIEMKETECSNTDLRNKRYEELSDKILQCKFEMNDIGRKANLELNGKKTDLSNKLADVESEISRAKWNMSLTEKNRENIIDSINKNEMLIKIKASDWKKANERVFDDSSLFCQYCGQEYPEDKKELLKAEFLSRKEDELKEIEHAGSKLREEISELEKEKQSLNNKVSEIEENIRLLKDKRTDVILEIDNLPDHVDSFDNEDYKRIESQLAEYQKSISEISEVSKEETLADIANLRNELVEVKTQIASAQRNVDIDERISELQERQREISQLFANEQKNLALLEDFNRAKMEMLTESINKHFSMVKFVLFAQQINGGYENVCYATVDGINYEKGLNDSDCLLANVDMISTFQKFNDIQLPIFLDRAESINKSRIPDIESQLVCMSVSDSGRLVVE